jgi:RHS repeat-associated protein
VTSESINGGNAIAFSYDNDGLLSKAGALTLNRSAQNGLISGTTLGLASDSRSYNSFGELTGYTASSQGGRLFGLFYTRDADGRISNKTEISGFHITTYTYSYDPAGRLVGVSKNGTAISSNSYDSNSNRLQATTPSGTVSATYDAQDRLLTYGAATYTYTANGELASQTVGTQTTAYQYDVLGNLVSASLPSGKAIRYLVDAENRRVGKIVNGTLVEGFLYDGDRIVAQLNGSNAIVSQFIYASGATSPDYMVSGGVTYRIFSDHLGSPRMVVNTSTGVLAEQITYDEFGNVLGDTNPGFEPFGFAGGLYDQDTKLVRFGARDYNPSTGRWTAKDPILFNGGDANLYGYVLNDPVNGIDPLGLQCGTCKLKQFEEKNLRRRMPRRMRARKWPRRLARTSSIGLAQIPHPTFSSSTFPASHR